MFYIIFVIFKTYKNFFGIKWLYATLVYLPFTCIYASICILCLIMIIDHVYNVYTYHMYLDLRPL